MKSDIETLSIIFVTDFHQQADYLSSLQKWYEKYTASNEPINYVFVGGDSMNIDNIESNAEEQEKGEKSIYAYFDKLKEIFNCELIHVPGNHDPRSILDPNGTMRIKEKNVHNQKIKLADGLELVGFGGSGPGFSEGQKVWQGYPYAEDKDFE